MDMIMEIERAMSLVGEARDIVDSVMAKIGGQPERHYHAYGKYGFQQLLNEGNPYDNGLEDIISSIEEMNQDY